MSTLRSFTFFLFNLFVFQNTAQSFVGNITYSIQYEISKLVIEAGITYETIENEADTLIVYYKRGFYKKALNLKTLDNWKVYNPDSAKIYEPDGSLCFVQLSPYDPIRLETGFKPKISLLDTIVKFDTIDLQVVEVRWEIDTILYMFNSNYFKINPENYVAHLYEGFYQYLKIAKSLPIKIISKRGITTTYSMLGFSIKPLNDSIFTIPTLDYESEENIYYGSGFFSIKIRKE